MFTMVPASDGRIPENVTSETKARRILAIDYGRKRIGLALSDELGITAQPLQTLIHKNRRDDVRRLRDICRAHGVARILVAIRCILPAKPGKWRMKRRGLRRGCAKNWGSK